MKELSIEQKAKRYDESINKAKECHTDGLSLHQPVKDVLEHIFPELKESEDERIRKEIIDYLSTVDDKELIPYESWIAWLEKQSTPQVRTGIEWVDTIDDACDKRYSEEYAHGEYCHEQSFKWGFQEGVDWFEKQGEQKPILDVEIPFGAKDSELQEVSYYIPEGFHAEIDGNRVVIKRGEQKPADTEKGAKRNEREIPNSAWSEEDENMLQSILDEYKSMLIEKRNWLNSLKDRYTWKPSEEQMKLLREVQQALLGKDCHNRFVNFMCELKRLREE